MLQSNFHNPLTPAVRTRFEELIDYQYGCETLLYREKVSTFPVDLYVLLADEDWRAPTAMDGHVLMTFGMASKPVPLPSPGANIQASHTHDPRAELQLWLHPEWPVDLASLQDERWYWPFRMVKELARHPHEANVHIQDGSIVVRSTDFKPYHPDYPYCGALLICDASIDHHLPPEEALPYEIYSVYPVYREEIEYAMCEGSEALRQRLHAADVLGLHDPCRPCTVTDAELTAAMQGARDEQCAREGRPLTLLN